MYDGDGTVGPLSDRFETYPPYLGGKGIGADDENCRAGPQLLLQQARCALCAGDDIVGLGREPHSAQMLGDFGRSARGVVGDIQHAGSDRGEGFDGAVRRFVAAEHGAVEVEK